MGSPSAASVVTVRFPFADLSRVKLRPAVVLATADRGDYLLCQITSNPYSDDQAILLTADDFAEGSLQRPSYARPSKLFTGNDSVLVQEVRRLREEKRQQIVDRIVQMLRDGSAR